MDMTVGYGLLPSGMLSRFEKAVWESDIILAHNAFFDRTVLEAQDWWRALEVPLEKWQCVMATALAHGLPGGLDRLSDIFKLEGDSKLEGKQFINLFCKPQKDGTRFDRDSHPAEWKEFLRYAEFDIHAMRALWKKMPKWNLTPTERKVWLLDQQINDRGIAVDVELAEAAIKATTDKKRELELQTLELTEGKLDRTTRRDAFLELLLADYDVLLPDLRADTVEKRLEDPELPEHVKELLRIRLQATKASTAKYKRVLQSHVGGRLHGLLQYCAANRTGRWGGRIFQPQNLPRPTHKKHEIEVAIDAMKAGCLHLLADDVMALASSALRGVLIAAPDHKLVISDLSNIEGRVLMWVVGEEWKLKAFADFDKGIGEDSYKLTYAKAFKADPKDITDYQRQQGKGLDLSMGYQGGVGAFLNIAAAYGLDLDELTIKAKDAIPKKILLDSYQIAQERSNLGLSKDTFAVCQSLVTLWRQAHPKTKAGWYQVEEAATAAIMRPGERFEACRCTFVKDKAWLRIILPSGRSLCYPGSRIENGVISYQGVSVYKKAWHRITTYGGKIIENIVQAISRDILAEAMLRVDPIMPIVLDVHDEIICEVPQDSVLTHEDLSAMLATNPPWAAGLPLAAKGFETTRYRKG